MYFQDLVSRQLESTRTAEQPLSSPLSTPFGTRLAAGLLKFFQESNTAIINAGRIQYLFEHPDTPGKSYDEGAAWAKQNFIELVTSNQQLALIPEWTKSIPPETLDTLLQTDEFRLHFKLSFFTIFEQISLALREFLSLLPENITQLRSLQISAEEADFAGFISLRAAIDSLLKELASHQNSLDELYQQLMLEDHDPHAFADQHHAGISIPSLGAGFDGFAGSMSPPGTSRIDSGRTTPRRTSGYNSPLGSPNASSGSGGGSRRVSNALPLLRHASETGTLGSRSDTPVRSPATSQIILTSPEAAPSLTSQLSANSLSQLMCASASSDSNPRPEQKEGKKEKKRSKKEQRTRRSKPASGRRNGVESTNASGRTDPPTSGSSQFGGPMNLFAAAATTDGSGEANSFSLPLVNLRNSGSGSSSGTP